MKIKTIHCCQNNPLPPKHFALLFEGAWLFTPEDDGRIMATCPIDSSCNPHECTFGIWNGGGLDQLEGFPPLMPEGGSYQIELDGFEKSTKSFDVLFREAATICPILYIPNKRADPSGSQAPTTFARNTSNLQSVRQVSIPLPTMVVPDGVLITAEIDGAGISDAVGVPARIPRPVITFLFIYEYCGVSATAIVKGNSGEIAMVTADQSQPTPHLVFNVHPGAVGMMGGMMGMDDAAQKSHTVATFDTLRQSVSKTSVDSKTGKPRVSLCDIAVYHGRGPEMFLYGFSGLDQYELGLAQYEGPLGARLASCASGNMVAGGS